MQTNFIPKFVIASVRVFKKQLKNVLEIRILAVIWHPCQPYLLAVIL